MEKEIKHNYNGEKNIIRRLEEVCGELNKISDKYNETENEITNVWKGQNADEFAKKSKDINNMLDENKKILEEITNHTKEISEKFLEAELKAEKLAKERKDGV